jgi:hypothetical protein
MVVGVVIMVGVGVRWMEGWWNARARGRRRIAHAPGPLIGHVGLRGVMVGGYGGGGGEVDGGLVWWSAERSLSSELGGGGLSSGDGPD